MMDFRRNKLDQKKPICNIFVLDDLHPETVSKARNEYILVNRNWNKQRNLIKSFFWNDPGVVKNSLSENFSADDIQMNILSTVHLLFEQTIFNFVS